MEKDGEISASLPPWEAGGLVLSAEPTPNVFWGKSKEIVIAKPAFLNVPPTSQF
jgi:hypothetical protein